MKHLTTLGIILAFVLTTVVYAQVPEREPLNVRVGGDIEIRGITRDNYNFNDKTGSDKDNQWYDSIVRVYVAADLMDDVSAYIRFVSTRDWGHQLCDTDERDVGLDLAYITMMDFMGWSYALGAPLDVSIGRQEIRIGEGFLIGDGETSTSTTYGWGENTTYNVHERNPLKGFDAIRITYLADLYTLDLFTAKAEEATIAKESDDVDIYGLNINIPYEDIGIYDIGLYHQNAADKREVCALSLRGESEIPAVPGLEVKGEVVMEWGDVGEDTGNRNSRAAKDKDVDALGYYAGVKYTFDVEREPWVAVNYISMSGDGDTTGDDEQFDPLYEDVLYGEIASSPTVTTTGAISNTNVEIINISAGLQATDLLAVSLDYYDFTREDAAAGVDDDLGDEFDLSLVYDYTEDLQFGLIIAYFDPGDRYGTADDEATEVLGTVKVSF